MDVNYEHDRLSNIIKSILIKVFTTVLHFAVIVGYTTISITHISTWKWVWNDPYPGEMTPIRVKWPLSGTFVLCSWVVLFTSGNYLFIWASLSFVWFLVYNILFPSSDGYISILNINFLKSWRMWQFCVIDIYIAN